MLQPVGSQRDGHNLATEQQQNVYVNVGIIGYMFIYLFFFSGPLKHLLPTTGSQQFD